METLANLEAFMRSAQSGSFSEAARKLGLTPAAVSRNVAKLESNLKTRLFHRSTRKLTLTEAGERLRLAIGTNLENIQRAVADIATQSGEPAGTLKVSLSLTFGIRYLLPLLPAFLNTYPYLRPEWHFENRTVDLGSEGYDAAIGAGFDLSQGVVARSLAPAHIIAVASPCYVATRLQPTHPQSLAALDGIVMRSLQTGRLRQWTVRNVQGEEWLTELKPSVVVNDPGAQREAALLGLGVALLAVPDVLPELESGRLVRLLPDWYADAGMISLYYSSRELMPAKTRVFVDWVVDAFYEQDFAKRFSAAKL